MEVSHTTLKYINRHFLVTLTFKDEDKDDGDKEEKEKDKKEPAKKTEKKVCLQLSARSLQLIYCKSGYLHIGETYTTYVVRLYLHKIPARMVKKSELYYSKSSIHVFNTHTFCLTVTVEKRVLHRQD